MRQAMKTPAETKARPHRAPGPGPLRPRRVSIAAIRFHSRWVAFLKFVLPAAALALLALVVAWPSLKDQAQTRLKPEEGQTEIVNPRYLSVDEKNQPYSLTAATAAQSPDRPGLLSLTKPQAEMTDSSGAWVTIDSELGWYDRTNGVLQMRGKVHVLRDDGSEFTTDEAFSEVHKGTAWGDRHVVGQGPQGEIVAEGFRIADRGRSVVFLNQSKADIQSKGGTVAPPKAAAPAPAKVSAVPAPAVAPTAPAAPAPQVAEVPRAVPVVEPVPLVEPVSLVPPAGRVLPRAKPLPPSPKAGRINVLDQEARPVPPKSTASTAKGDRT